MGIMTAVAIAIHNFPEGLATYVATLEDEKLGISVAIAIALHNIPGTERTGEKGKATARLIR